MSDLPIVTNLDHLLRSLPDQSRERFNRIFHLSSTVGHLVPPRLMQGWIKSYFGSVEAVTEQQIVKLTNLITWEGALFNDLRASRPIEARNHADLIDEIVQNGNGPFSNPLDGTPEDVFGRVQGQHSITASNIAKYDGFHGLVIFDEHDPLHFTREAVSDYIDTALAWAHKAHHTDPQARYFLFLWNCLWKSGASIIHGHAQMTLSRDMHYCRVEALRRAALVYRQRHGSSYFDDLYAIHQDLGLTFGPESIRAMAYLTPVKEKEIILMADEITPALKDELYRVLCHFTQKMNVLSFNVALHMPPLTGPANLDEDWDGFPVMIRVVDRGDLSSKSADFGGMELYAQSVIGTDPFYVARALGNGQGCS